MVDQKKIKLNAYPRGFHLITEEVIKHLPKITGVVNVFIQHTSASLTINENADLRLEKILKHILIKWFLKKKLILNTLLKDLMT